MITIFNASFSWKIAWKNQRFLVLNSHFFEKDSPINESFPPKILNNKKWKDNFIKNLEVWLSAVRGKNKFWRDEYCYVLPSKGSKKSNAWWIYRKFNLNIIFKVRLKSFEMRKDEGQTLEISLRKLVDILNLSKK